MANFFKRTTLQLRQPLACFSALAAGCLISGNLSGDEQGKQGQDTVQPTNLERLFTQEKIQFSPVPPIQSPAMTPMVPLRQPSQVASPGRHAPSLRNTMQMTGNKSQFEQQSHTRTRVQNSNQASSPAIPNVSATTRNSGLPAASLGRLGVGAKESGVATDYPTSLASWQEPGGSQSRAFSQMPLSQQQAPRVAQSTPSPVGPKIRTGVHRLANVDMERFETAVVSTWGDRLKASTSQDGRYVRVEMPTRVKQRMAMMIDRQTQTLTYEGDDSLRENWHQLVERLDSVPFRRSDGRVEQIELVDPNRAELATIQQAAFLMGLSQDITQPAAGGQDEQSITLPPGTTLPQGIQQGALTDTVKILQDPETGAITLVGTPEDIAIVRKIIEDISKTSKASQAQVKTIPLVNLQSEAISEQLQETYDATYSGLGITVIKPLQSPNALLVVGQAAGIAAVEEMVKQMDVYDASLDASGFKTFALKHISALDAKSRLDSYFIQANTGEGLQLPSAPVAVIADFRSNSVIVKGAKKFRDEAEALLKEIDVAELDGKTSTVKVFQLRNTLAEEMAIVLQDAISGQQPNAGQGYNPNQQAQTQQNQNQQIQPDNSSLGSTQLSLKMIDNSGQEVKSGIMFDVRVTADRNSNSLVVTGPEESMDLIGELIEQLDRLPNAETQIKVFEIINGDAETLLTMLEGLFGSDTTQLGGGQQGTSNLSQLPLQGVSATDGATLINLRFSFEPRTNTIIASGPGGDLQVVEDLLNRLDAQDMTDRAPRVYRLSNAPARDVVEAINEYLEPRNDINANDPRSIGTYIQADRSVIVVAETVSNSVIVSATPVQRAEIEELIRGLDRRPPMVKVKVLIAEVELDSAEEFGVDMGIQDSLLFDRGTIVSADDAGQVLDTGFPFLNNPGASNANRNAVFPETLAGQALSSLGVGTSNSALGYGGLVLSAANESVSILLRALKDKRAVRILSRPTITTVENLQGRVQIGSSVPRVAGSTLNGQFAQQDIVFEDVGVILEVTPRVSPDGMIVLAVNATNSSVSDDGVSIGRDQFGDDIIAQIINETTATTTLMARSGQTVVFSGLIEESKVHRKRGAPIISDLPWVGPLFSYESDAAQRRELMIIMTPYLITNDQDIATQNQDDMDRMHWCLCDVAEVYGDTDYYGFQGTEPGIQTIYPDADPSGLRGDPLYKVIDAKQPNQPSLPPQVQTDPQRSLRPAEIRQASHASGTGEK